MENIVSALKRMNKPITWIIEGPAKPIPENKQAGVRVPQVLKWRGGGDACFLHGRQITVFAL